VRVDFRRAEVLRSGVPVTLSALEFKLLAYFIQNRGALLSRDELLDKVWGYDAMPTTRTVDVHVASLRQKLEGKPVAPRVHPHRSTGGATASPADRRARRLTRLYIPYKDLAAS